MKRNILVTGANGQLGSEIQALSSAYSDYAYTFCDREMLDLSSEEAIKAYFEANSFDVIINCAAYTAVDKAESDEELAFAINHKAVETLAHIVKAKNMVLIHISTDYVFDGSNFKPYVENDPTNPQSVYGASKLAGEEALLSINPANSIIIRTSWVYSTFGNNFVKTMLRLGRERDELGVIFDQVGTPTYARDLAKSILEILPKLNSESVEIFHYSNEGVCSWYDFAKAIFEVSNINCKVNPIETSEYPTPATRPHYSLLNKSKIKNSYAITIPYWRDSLIEALANMEH
ncbi:MAG: dTDP-4-dehydrorhamnose reductase [Sulfurimonadaceae bacterium]